MPTLRRGNRFPSLAGLLRLRRETIDAHPRRYVKILLACLGVLLVVDAVVAWPHLKARLQAVAVLDRVGNQPVPALVRWLVVEPVKTTELTLPLPSGPVCARMYTPVNHPNAPAMVVVHGVHYLGMDEPRLEAFAVGDGVVRFAGADAGAAGYQGLPYRAWVDCYDRRCYEVDGGRRSLPTGRGR